MKCGNSSDLLVHKDVVIIGNGPSGIALSYMLRGNVPYVVSANHPDELLSLRLENVLDRSLIDVDLGFLASGLEGRTTNPVSLLLDNLIHPGADVGLEFDPLIEWRNNGHKEIIMNTCRKLVESVTFFKDLPLVVLVRIVSCLKYDIFLTNDIIAKVGTPGNSMYFISNGTVAIYSKTGKEIDHVVLGKGPPGGSWHSMDPEILTLSLASWMSLPGKKFESRKGSEKRATAKSVAEYYDQYVAEMGLQKYFRNQVLVTRIQPYSSEFESLASLCPSKKLCSRFEDRVESLRCRASFRNPLNYFLRRGFSKRCPKRCKGSQSESFDNNKYNGCRFKCKKQQTNGRKNSLSAPAGPQVDKCDRCSSNNTDADGKPQVPSLVGNNCCDFVNGDTKWIVEAVDLKTKALTTYTCNHLVLANGTSDLPNRLSISNDFEADPYWLLHDLRSLEIELDIHLQQNKCAPDPVLVVGAGLSAADAIIAIKARNLPVIHLFRNKTDVTKQLPENMYPEYHKVHQMMKDGSNYPLYTALAEHTLTRLDETTHTATITSKEGKEIQVKVSFAIVLIGSRPDFRFLPDYYNLGAKKHLPIDGKKNTVNINKMTHSVKGHQNLYAIGPLAGDNFVRFLPGGALATLCDLYKCYD